jgi:hypothetical protein
MAACVTGLSRQLESIENNRKPRFKEQYEGQLLLMHQLAACSEMACAKILNSYYSHTVNTFHVADIGKDIEVRFSNTGNLKVREDDNDVFIHAMSGNLEEFTWHGFVWSEDAKIKEYYKDPNNVGKPAYFIPIKNIGEITMNLWEYLENLKGSMEINKLAGDRDSFIKRVKVYIDKHEKGSQIEFNSDYTKIKKVNFEF